MKPLVVLALLIVEAGCEASPPPQAPNTPKIPAVRDDVGLVMILRFGQGLRMTTGSVPVYLDGKEVLAVRDWRYTYLWVTPGHHQFKAAWSPLEKPRNAGSKFDDSTLDLDVEADKAYFLNYQIVDDATHPPSPLAALAGPFAKSTIISAGLILETHESGRSHVSFCAFQENHWR